ncbi:hypothetical protein CE153_07645 [Bifidobacterium sp. N4G05]|nr:hypothetical protein CE153_07645 [Bifidobacterium sp. N4G05]
MCSERSLPVMEGTFLHMVIFVRSGLLHANCELSTVVIRLWIWAEFSTYPQIFKVRWRRMI